MGVGIPLGLVLVLALNLILMMSVHVESRNHLPSMLGPMSVVAGATARLHGLGLGLKSSPPLAPSPNDSISPPSDDMEPSSPLAPTPPNPSTPSPLPSSEPSMTPSPTPPLESPSPQSSAPVESPHPSPSRNPESPSPQSSTPSPTPQSPSPLTPPKSPPSPKSSPPSPPLAPSPKRSTPPSPPSKTSPNKSPKKPSTPPPSSESSTKGLKVGFYNTICPMDVEALITTLVEEEFRQNATILPALLRMQFHDCFVHGCDASILIDGDSSEKMAGANLSVRGYEFIEALKAALEEKCPNTVSCADIIAIATKVVLKLGGGPEYQVETGRRDGVVSNALDVNLPSPDMTASQGIAIFAAKNITAEEMVVLLGAHTVGITHCGFFQDRLYSSTPSFDPKMDPSLRQELIPVCPQGTLTNNPVFLDQNPESSNIVDTSFYVQILNQRGILEFDQELARDPLTVRFVQQLATNATVFNDKLALAMIKLQAVEVLTGTQGQIRKVCSRIN